MQAISRPLAPGWQTRRTWFDGRATSQVFASFIKPNDRLTSLERLEIYNKQYWFRLLDCLYDDYPGLRAILGQSRFRRLSIAYLEKYPSDSFTLRNLGSRLEKFLLEHPEWPGPTSNWSWTWPALSGRRSSLSTASQGRRCRWTTCSAATRRASGWECSRISHCWN